MRTIKCKCGTEYQVPKRKPRRKRQRNSPYILSEDDYLICRCGCWLWKWSVKRGYARVLHLGKVRLVSRIILDIVDSDKHALHSCDNPRCINLEHLYEGTQQQNMDDMYERCRAVNHTGENHGRAKLTETDVENIRAEYAAGGITYKELAERYGVSQTLISNIINRKQWKHI